jgi:hypothetical protein
MMISGLIFASIRRLKMADRRKRITYIAKMTKIQIKMCSGTRRLLQRLPENGHQYTLCWKTPLTFFPQIS